MRIAFYMRRKPQIQAVFIPWRYYFVLALISIIAFGLVIRVIDLTIFRHHFLQKEGNQRVLREVSVPAFRGMIVDRYGYPLAVSTTVDSIWVNPNEFKIDSQSLRALSKLLGMKAKEITALINRNLTAHREFAYLKRNLPPDTAKQIKALGIPGVYAQEEYHRYYPEGEVSAHVIGFTNVDDEGQEGLELAYNNWLQGEKGKKLVIKDRLGRVIDDVQTLREQKQGRNLVLSIDRRIQYLTYKALLQGVTENKAESGSAIVLDVKTGEVLAMVNQPSFNPNSRQNRVSSAFRNRAVTDSFEPGSTIKAFTIASALESGRKPDTEIDTSPGWMRLDNHEVKDEKNNGILSYAEILQISSNMGAARIVLGLPRQQLSNLLHRMGFGEITGIGFPGEQSGFLPEHAPWGAFTLATLSFGYGLSVTPMQLARAYAILANHGVKIPVSLLKITEPKMGEQVIPAKVANEMLDLLETVVYKGVGRKAQIVGYRVAGKTGTSIKAGNKGYEKHHYNSSFVGIAPVSNPRLVVAVVIHEPQGKNYLGAVVSAPIFKEIMEGALRTLAIAPDAEEESGE